MPSPTPRCFIIRHGETEWSLDGRHTGTSDIPLTANGESRVIATGRALVGPNALIVPDNLAAIFVSPRTRARRTLELLMEQGLGGTVQTAAQCRAELERRGVDVEVREDVREWDYGEYEGVTSAQIAEQRKKTGERKWDIWRDGCPGGESPQQVTERLDAVIKEIRERFHAPAIAHKTEGKGGKAPSCDVLVVAHGHILRAFAARWIGKHLEDNPSLLLEAGGVGTLSYEHHSIDEPAIMLGGAFVVDAVEKAEGKK